MTDEIDGDRFLSGQDRHIWSLIYSVIEKFGCLVAFKKTGPWTPMYRNCYLQWYVPRHHRHATEIKAYLEHESKALLFVQRQTEDDWYPNTYVQVFMYSGMDSYLDRDTMDELTEHIYDSLMQSLKEEKRKADG